MNDINFVNSASHAQQQAIGRWLAVTIIAGILVISGITCLQLYQWYRLAKVQRERSLLQEKTKDFELILNKKQELLQRKEQLEKQLAKLSRHKNSPKLPLELMTALKSTTGKPIQLQSMHIEKDKLKITAMATQPAQATQFVSQLQAKAPVKEVKLVAMKSQHDNGQKQLLFTVEATIVQ